MTGRRRERFAFDAEMARTLIDEPTPQDGIWSRDLLDAHDPEGRYRPHLEDLVGRAGSWLSALDDCVMFAVNAVERRPIPPEFGLREFLRVDPDDDAQLCEFIRSWGPLDLSPLESVVPITRDAVLEEYGNGKDNRPSLRNPTDPEDSLDWWRICLSALFELVESVDADDWESHFVSFNDSSCGDFGIRVDTSPVRLQRSLMHLYQALFETWIAIVRHQNLTRAGSSPR